MEFITDPFFYIFVAAVGGFIAYKKFYKKDD